VDIIHVILGEGVWTPAKRTLSQKGAWPARIYGGKGIKPDSQKLLLFVLNPTCVIFSLPLSLSDSTLY